MVKRSRKKRRSVFNLVIKLFFAFALAGIGLYYSYQFFFPPTHVFYPGFEIEIPQDFEIHGIDVSRYQQQINWEEVAQMEVKGIRIGFVFIKATEGLQNVDPKFKQNWRNAAKNNIPKGAYHFFIPGKDAKGQAENFIKRVSLEKGDLPPVLDIEMGRRFSVTQMQKEVKIWLDMVENRYGMKPVIYTNIDFYRKYFSSGFEEYPLWIAHYLQPQKPRIINKWVFWQHSEKGRVNGIKSRVDFNVFYGDSTDFEALLKD